MRICDDSKKIIQYFLQKAIECGSLDENFVFQYDALSNVLGLPSANYCRICLQFLRDCGYVTYAIENDDDVDVDISETTVWKIKISGQAIYFLENN